MEGTRAMALRQQRAERHRMERERRRQLARGLLALLLAMALMALAGPDDYRDRVDALTGGHPELAMGDG